MELSAFAQWVLGAAALLTAGGVVWKFGRRLYRIDSAMPVLLQISNQFDPERGSATLYARIVSIEQRLGNIEAALKITSHVVDKVDEIPEPK